MNELSTHSWPPREKAVPKKWVQTIFSKMSAFYGDKFTNMWKGLNLEEIQIAWAMELHKISPEQLRSGVEGLTAFNRPPTLPEFIQHCRQARFESVASTAPKLEQSIRADEKTVDANVKKMLGIVKGLHLANAHPGWAFDFCLRQSARSGEAVTVDTWAHVREAILSDAGRVYAHEQIDDRNVDCVRVLRKVIKDAVNNVSKFHPYEEEVTN